MLTLKEMVIEVLKKEDTSLSAKDLTDKLVLEFADEIYELHKKIEDN